MKTRQDKTRKGHRKKINQKLVEKSTKNLPKINKKHTKYLKKSLLEGSRGAFGGSWRPIPKNEGRTRFFGDVLGPSWRPLGPSWRPLGPVLAVLAASWARLGPLLAAEIGPQVDQISTQKIDQNFDAFWDRLLGGF